MLGSEFLLPGKRLEIHYGDQNLIGIGDLKGDMDQEEVGVEKNQPKHIEVYPVGLFYTSWEYLARKNVSQWK